MFLNDANCTRQSIHYKTSNFEEFAGDLNFERHLWSPEFRKNSVKPFQEETYASRPTVIRSKLAEFIRRQRNLLVSIRLRLKKSSQLS